MALFKPFRGSHATLDTQPLHDGYAYFCTDDGSFHIDYEDADGNLQRKQISAKDCESIMGMSLDELKAHIANQDTVVLAESQTYTDVALARISDKISTISLPASGWTEATNVYSQVVAVPGATSNSKVDIYPTPEQIVDLQISGISLVAVNEDGVVTVYAINNKPTSDYSMQVTLTELSEGA